MTGVSVKKFLLFSLCQSQCLVPRRPSSIPDGCSWLIDQNSNGCDEYMLSCDTGTTRTPQCAQYQHFPCQRNVNATIMFYFDVSARMCIPLNYPGCGNYMNLFKFQQDCIRQCEQGIIVPDQPTNVQISNVMHTSMVVSWNAPISLGILAIRYRVTFTPTIGGGLPKIIEVAATPRVLNMTHLTPDTQYSITVIAFNDAGESRATTSYRMTTSPAPITPTKLIIWFSEKTSESFVTTWNAIPNSRIYKINFVGSKGYRKTRITPRTTYKANSLPASGKYTVTVLVVNNDKTTSQATKTIVLSNSGSAPVLRKKLLLSRKRSSSGNINNKLQLRRPYPKKGYVAKDFENGYIYENLADAEKWVNKYCRSAHVVKIRHFYNAVDEDDLYTTENLDDFGYSRRSWSEKTQLGYCIETGSKGCRGEKLIPFKLFYVEHQRDHITRSTQKAIQKLNRNKMTTSLGIQCDIWVSA